MSKNLVIVESPAKAKTIGRYLGRDFRITASVGHIRDLPASKLGVDVENQYKPQYTTMKGKEKVIRELKEMAEQSDRVLIATDPDSEGESIAWHLAHILKMDAGSPCRISFNEITESAVREAVAHPRSIDQDLFNSQQARRILDRLVGYELSPLLWKKVKKGLSAGRVQSVATRLVVEREREIDAFKPEEYWLLSAWLKPDSDASSFRSRYHGQLENGKIKKKKLTNGDETEAVISSVRDQAFTVYEVTKKKRQRQPAPPFTTSTLQQEAARYLGYSSRRTMQIAQQLYEGIELAGQGSISLVTYIRTDSVRVSGEAAEAARMYIQDTFGTDYLPRVQRRYKNKSSSQDAHEAIRPAHFDMSPNQLQAKLSNEQFRLYRLIWDKFVASQMAAAEINTVTADILAGDVVFRSQGESVAFPGYLAQYGVQLVDQETDKKPEENGGKDQLPELSKDQELMLDRLEPEQKFTQPPARYTEASLIKAMEEKGIGRPSTYAPTISTILDRLYVDKNGKYLIPTELGKAVTGMLEIHFSNIVDVSFTARMEADLDTVESGEKDWIRLLDEFYPTFHQQIEDASTIDRVKIASTPTGEKCPECETGDLVIKEGRFGKFIACSNYPDCKYTRNIENQVNGKCPLCGSGLLSRMSYKYKKSFFTCDKQGSDPECPFISWDLPIEGKKCDTCGSYMVLKRYRGRSFPKCGNRDCPTNEKKVKKETGEQGKSSDKKVEPTAKKAAPKKRKTAVRKKKTDG